MSRRRQAEVVCFRGARKLGYTPGSGPWYWADYGSTPKQFVDALRAVLGLGPLAEEQALRQMEARAAAKVAQPSSMPDAR